MSRPLPRRIGVAVGAVVIVATLATGCGDGESQAQRTIEASSPPAPTLTATPTSTDDTVSSTTPATASSLATDAPVAQGKCAGLDPNRGEPISTKGLSASSIDARLKQVINVLNDHCFTEGVLPRYGMGVSGACIRDPNDSQYEEQRNPNNSSIIVEIKTVNHDYVTPTDSYYVVYTALGNSGDRYVPEEVKNLSDLPVCSPELPKEIS